MGKGRRVLKREAATAAERAVSVVWSQDIQATLPHRHPGHVEGCECLGIQHLNAAPGDERPPKNTLVGYPSRPENVELRFTYGYT